MLDHSGLRLRCGIHLGSSLHSEDLHGCHRYHPGHDSVRLEQTLLAEQSTFGGSPADWCLRLEHCKGFAQGVASNGRLLLSQSLSLLLMNDDIQQSWTLTKRVAWLCSVSTRSRVRLRDLRRVQLCSRYIRLSHLSFWLVTRL